MRRRRLSFIAFGLCMGALLSACISPTSVPLGLEPAGAQDAGPDAATGLCLRNPMFYGSPTTDDGGIGRGSRTLPILPDWQICDGNVQINPGNCTLLSSTGMGTYLGLYVESFQGTILSTPLSSPVPPGSYPFSIDLGLAVTSLRRGGFGMPASTPVELHIYGSAGACSNDEELAVVPAIMNPDSWVTYSGTLIAQKTFSNLVIVSALSNVQGGVPPRGQSSYLIMGNFVSPTCH